MSRVKSTLRVRAPGAASFKPASMSAPGQVYGRSVFAVRTLEHAVSVETMLLQADGQLQRMPALFPSRAYAMEQIEQLMRIVQQHFDQLQHKPADTAQDGQPSDAPAA